MKTLIIEDDPVSTKVLAKLLVNYGMVVTAGTAREAFEIYNDSAFSSTPFDLICLDLQLRGDDGREFLNEIRKAEKASGIPLPLGVKIVVITSNSDPGLVEELQQQGCDAYITKPLNKELLTEELQKLNLI